VASSVERGEEGRGAGRKGKEKEGITTFYLGRSARRRRKEGERRNPRGGTLYALS